MKDEFLKEVLEKFAVSGAMYSRALGNAARRSGGRIAPKVLDQIAAQPRAKSIPQFSEKARTPGVVPFKHEQESHQGVALLPLSESEYHHDAGARLSTDKTRGFMVPAQLSAVDAYNAWHQQAGNQVGVASNRARETTLERNRQYRLHGPALPGATADHSPNLPFDKTPTPTPTPTPKKRQY